MEKRNWILVGLLVIAAIVAGPKRIEPLVDEFMHDPAVGTFVVILILIVILVVARVVMRD
jgi:hypothetical protein